MTQANIDAYTSGGTTFVAGGECSGGFVAWKLDHWGYPVSGLVEGSHGWAFRVGLCDSDPKDILDDAAYAALQTHGVTEVASSLLVEDPGQLQLTVRAILHGLGHLAN